MAAPTRNLFGTATTGAVNADTLTVSPTAAGSAVGDVIDVFVASDGVQTMTTGSSGWSKIAQINEATSQVCLGLFRHVVATAATVPSLVVDMGATTEMAVAHWFRIRPSAGAAITALAPVTAQGSSTNPNPASISNGSGATQDLYYLAAWGGDGNNVLSTAAPASYANHQSTGIANNGGANIGSADRTRTAVANGGAEDPATFTRATEQWAALSVAYYETASVPGNASGTIGTAAATAPEGTGGGGGLASGALVTSASAAPAGAASGAGNATGEIGTRTTAAPNGSAIGESGGGASGSIGIVLATPPSATGSGNAATSGAIPVANSSAPAATAGVSASASGSLPTVAGTPPQASAGGYGAASGTIGNVIAFPPLGAVQTVTPDPPELPDRRTFAERDRLAPFRSIYGMRDRIITSRPRRRFQ